LKRFPFQKASEQKAAAQAAFFIGIEQVNEPFRTGGFHRFKKGCFCPHEADGSKDKSAGRNPGPATAAPWLVIPGAGRRDGGLGLLFARAFRIYYDNQN
jgi:hypothetical protein